MRALAESRPALGDRRSKRLFDLCLVLLSLPVWSTALLLLGLIVKLDSRGPAFFGHGRIGFRGQPFRMWKLRTMVRDADHVLAEHLASRPEAMAEWRATQKLREDPRMTRVGKWLRRFSLDELPQVVNVLLGNMSLVGPRPLYDPEEIGKWGERFSIYQEAKPGLTGLWQVSGRNDTTYEERIGYDSQYIRNWTLGSDLSILSRTFEAVLSGRGAY